MSTLLDASERIEPVLRHAYRDVAEACAELGIDYVVVGASARDLVLHHVYGAPVSRVTMDVDFGLNIGDWDAFGQLRDALAAKGYARSRSPHRLSSPMGITVDIVPFGPLAGPASNIAWPPNGDTKMSVLGFREAYEDADLVRIQGAPPIDLRVATPIGMALLKIIAWQERALDVRAKDAKDLLYLLGNYSRIPEVFEAIYADPSLGERHDWDIDRMSAELLGQRAAGISRSETVPAIIALADRPNDVDALCREASDGIDEAVERTGALVGAFLEGYRARLQILR